MHVTNLKRKDNNQREEKKKKLTLKRRKDYKVINSVKITSLRKGSNTSLCPYYYLSHKMTLRDAWQGPISIIYLIVDRMGGAARGCC